MVATVFFMQPIGQACATIIALICTAAFKSRLECDQGDAACKVSQARALDRLWRLIVGLGAVPAALALFFRLTIPESIRYTMDVQRNLARASYDASWHTQAASRSVVPHQNGNAIQPAPDRQANHLQAVPIHHGPLGINIPAQNGNADHNAANDPEQPVGTGAQAPLQGHSPHSAESSVHDSDSDTSSDNGVVEDWEEGPGIPSFSTYAVGLYRFIFQHSGWRPLIGATMNWLLLDYAFYGIGLSSLNFASFVWNGGRLMQVPIYDTLIENGRNSIILVSIGASIGGLLMILFVTKFQLRTIQFCGFIVLALIMILAGAPFEAALEHKAKAWLMICFIASQIFFNFGPNSTTFIIPTEVFPTKYRCTCHGLSAAFGKLGSLLGQIFVTFVEFDGTAVAYGSVRNATTGHDEIAGPFQPKKANATGNTLLTFMPFLLLGALITYYFTPATQYEGGEPASLEEIEDKLYGRDANWVGKRNLGTAPAEDADDEA